MLRARRVTPSGPTPSSKASPSSTSPSFTACRTAQQLVLVANLRRVAREPVSLPPSRPKQPGTGQLPHCACTSFEKAPSSESHRSSMMIGRTTAAWLKTETRFGAQPAARSKTKIHMIPAQDRRCRSGWGGTFPPA